LRQAQERRRWRAPYRTQPPQSRAACRGRALRQVPHRFEGSPGGGQCPQPKGSMFPSHEGCGAGLQVLTPGHSGKEECRALVAALALVFCLFFNEIRQVRLKCSCFVPTKIPQSSARVKPERNEIRGRESRRSVPSPLSPHSTR
jgi:hypothetical protein